MRARHAKQALAGAAALAFAAALVFARTSQPGAAVSSGAASPQTPSVSSEDDGGFEFGEGSIGSSAGVTPQVRSGVS